MSGGILKITPVLEAGVGQFANPPVATFQSYFPVGTWVNIHDLSEVVKSTGDYYPITDSVGCGVHIRDGAILGIQNRTGAVDLFGNTRLFNVTADLVDIPISLLLNRDANGAASGTLLLDGGLLRSEIYEY